MRSQRPPVWRITLLTALLLATIAVLVVRHHGQPARSVVGLRGHTATIGVAGSAWPEAMHDAGHSGTSGSTGPQTGRVRWTRRLEGNGTPGPVVGAHGQILAATNRGVLHALDPLTGKDDWTYQSGSSNGTDLSVSPAVLPNGVVVWSTPGGSLLGLSPSGSLLWQLALHSSGTSPAILPDGSGVVVGDQAGWIYAVTVPAVGAATIRWSLNLGQTSYGSVALTTDGGTAYQTVDGAVVAVREGRIAWQHALPDPVEVSPAATPDGGVVTGAGDTKEYAFNAAGRLIWTHDRGAETYSSPVVTPDGLVAFGDHAGIISLVAATTGKLQARFAGLGHRQYPRTIGIWSSPVIDRGHDVYFATFQGHIEGFAPNGHRLFDLDGGTAVDSYPALTQDGGLVVADTGGTIRMIADR